MQELATDNLKSFDPSSRPQQARKFMYNTPLRQHQAQMVHVLPPYGCLRVAGASGKPTNLLAHNSPV